jgi:hypothetical protein
MRTLTLLPFLALVACDTPVIERGHATACLAGDVADNLYELYETSLLFEVEGTVISDEAGAMPETPMECYWTIDRVLTIEDAEGTTWTLGYGVADPDGEPVTFSLDLEPGQSVSLLFRSVQQFGAANGFVLQDDDGLVAALESGTWGPALEASDVPGLRVKSGSMIGTIDSDCGTEGHFAWAFEADETIEVEPFSHDAITIDGAVYSALAVANLQWQGDVQCTDLAGDGIWAVYR